MTSPTLPLPSVPARRGAPARRVPVRPRPRARALMMSALLGVLLLGGTACGQQGSDDLAHLRVAEGDPARGEEAIRAYACGACHTIPGVRGATGLAGPPLVSFARRAYIAGRVSNTPELLVRWIVRPQAIEPGTAMPNLGVTDEDARDIAAYLYTLR